MEVLLLFLGVAVFLIFLFSRKDSAPPPPPPDRPVAPSFTPRALPADDLRRAHRPSIGAGSLIKGRCWVIDGDTIVIGEHNIRIAGIDAPELDHPYGQNAKSAMIRLCKGQVIRAHIAGEFSYNRIVAICHLEDGRDLAAELVKQGLALDWPRYSGGKYRHLEPDGIRKKLWRADARQRGKMPPSGR